ncbi:hypothetical protein [Nostoc sp.]|uniref:hypothetical protein n=1 Tax=Nostoc sp. TaxID=1180 RepID=UPI002FF9B536
MQDVGQSHDGLWRAKRLLPIHSLTKPSAEKRKMLEFFIKIRLANRGTDKNDLRHHPSAEPKTVWLWSVEEISKDSLSKFESVTLPPKVA